MYCGLWYMTVNRAFLLILLLEDGNDRARLKSKLLLYLVLWVRARITLVVYLISLSTSYVCGLLFSSNALRRFYLLHATFVTCALLSCPPPQPIPRPRSAAPIIPSLILLISAPCAPFPPAGLIYIAPSAPIRPPSAALPNTGITVDY